MVQFVSIQWTGSIEQRVKLGMDRLDLIQGSFPPTNSLLGHKQRETEKAFRALTLDFFEARVCGSECVCVRVRARLPHSGPASQSPAAWTRCSALSRHAPGGCEHCRRRIGALTSDCHTPVLEDADGKSRGRINMEVKRLEFVLKV